MTPIRSVGRALSPRAPLRRSCAISLALAISCGLGTAADMPHWGEAWSRNQVSAEKNIPAEFNAETSRNIRWRAKLGTEAHATPVIAGGRVYVGTNNGQPRDPKHKGDRSVLMCFSEATGEFLWQLVISKRPEDIYLDWPHAGICSAPTVEGDRVYVVTSRGEVVCLDAKGMANGNDGPYKDEGLLMTPKDEEKLEPGPMDADVLWYYNLQTQAGIWPHDSAHTSILIRGDHLYLNTGTGVDNTHRNIRTPDAPSIVVMDKHTGRLLARDQLQIATNIYHATWSSPSMAVMGGRELLYFAGGNGIVYAFDPLPAKIEPLQTLKPVWEFDFDPDAPKTNIHSFKTNRKVSPSNIFGMPVFVDGRLYVAGGGDLWWGKNQAWLKCLDARAAEMPPQKRLLWSYELSKHVMATPAVHDGMVFIADTGGQMHCVDAATGKGLWTHPLKGEAWASCMVVDGKVIVGTRGSMVYVFKAAREKELLSAVATGSPISGTAIAANSALYLVTMKELFVIGNQRAPAP